jgi:hypothetical protein
MEAERFTVPDIRVRKFEFPKGDSIQSEFARLRALLTFLRSLDLGFDADSSGYDCNEKHFGSSPPVANHYNAACQLYALKL